MRSLSLFLAIYLLLGSLFPGMDFSQLVSTGVLFHHFQDHLQEAKDQNDELSLVDFLFEHFVEIDSHQHDQAEDHMRLPFQQLNVEIQLYYVQLNKLEVPHSPFFFHSTPSYLDHDPGENWTSSIFHPPSWN